MSPKKKPEVPVPMMSRGEAANFSIAGTLMLVNEEPFEFEEENGEFLLVIPAGMVKMASYAMFARVEIQNLESEIRALKDPK